MLLNSKFQLFAYTGFLELYSRFHSPGFRIPKAKICRIPESEFLYLVRVKVPTARSQATLLISKLFHFILFAVEILLLLFTLRTQFGSMPVLGEVKTIVYITNHNMVQTEVWRSHKRSREGSTRKTLINHTLFRGTSSHPLPKNCTATLSPSPASFVHKRFLSR